MYILIEQDSAPAVTLEMLRCGSLPRTLHILCYIIVIGGAVTTSSLQPNSSYK